MRRPPGFLYRGLPDAELSCWVRPHPRVWARIAGVLYPLNGIFAGFAFGYVISRVYVAGDAATTAGKAVRNSGLVRIGVVADLFQATEWPSWR